MEYSFNVKKIKVEEHVFFVIESNILKGCVAQGDTLDDALALFSELEREWLETAKKYDIPIPKESIQEETSYSGKLMIRLSKSLHKKIAQEAEKESTSINQLIVSILSESIGYKKGVMNAYRQTILNLHQKYKANILNCTNGFNNIKYNKINYQNGGKYYETHRYCN